MKNVILICAVLLFASCGKKKYCFQCQQFNPINETWTMEAETHCNWTNEDRKNYQDIHDTYITVGGKQYRSFMSCSYSDH